MANSAHLGFSLIAQNQSQKEVTANEALTAIDALLNTGIIDKDLTTPPGSPSDGDVYIVAAIGTGAWASHDLDIAFYATGWRFISPREGLQIWVNDEDRFYVFDGSAWKQSTKQVGKTSLWIPAHDFSPNAGSEAAGSLSVTEVTAGKPHLKGLEFTTSGMRRAQTSVQLPSAWNASGVEVRVHWATRTSGTNIARWRVTAVAESDGDNITKDYATETNVDDASNGADKRNISALTSITIGGPIVKAANLELQVSRQYDGSTDTINASLYLLGVELLYVTDQSLDA